MARITYLGNRQNRPGALDDTAATVTFADHDGPKVFEAGVETEVPFRLGAVLLSGIPANERIPVVGPKAGTPCFELTITQDELDFLTGKDEGNGSNLREWGVEGPYRSAYENIIKRHPKHLKVVQPEAEGKKAAK